MLRANSTFNVQSVYCHVHSKKNKFPYAMHSSFAVHRMPNTGLRIGKNQQITHRTVSPECSNHLIFTFHFSDAQTYRGDLFAKMFLWVAQLFWKDRRCFMALVNTGTVLLCNSIVFIDWFLIWSYGLCAHAHQMLCLLSSRLSWRLHECCYFSHTLPMKVYAPLRLPSTRCPIVFQLFVWMWKDYLTAYLLYYLRDKHLYDSCGSSHLYCCGDLKRCCKYHNIRQGSISCFPFSETLHRKYKIIILLQY